MVKLLPCQDCLQALQQRRACWAGDAAALGICWNWCALSLGQVLPPGCIKVRVVHTGQAVGPLVFLLHPWHYWTPVWFCLTGKFVFTIFIFISISNHLTSLWFHGLKLAFAKSIRNTLVQWELPTHFEISSFCPTSSIFTHQLHQHCLELFFIQSCKTWLCLAPLSYQPRTCSPLQMRLDLLGKGCFP